MMYEQVLKARPGVAPTDFSLRDDGIGPYIERWDDPRPKPTQAEIEAVAQAAAASVSAQTAIAELERLETPRRLAEAVLSAEGKAWLTSNREKIAALRTQL
jgi:hypothetical protein